MENSVRAKPKLIVVHGHAESPHECWPGEEVVAVYLLYRGKRLLLPLGPTHLIFFDFLCRHRWIALDAWQIEAKMGEDPFVWQHASNVGDWHERPARTSRTAVRQQIRRMRAVLAELIKEEGLDLDANEIIRSEETSTRVVRYRITIDVIWEHWSSSDGDSLSDPRLPKIPPALLGPGTGVRLEAQW